jgi:hypothetical protein
MSHILRGMPTLKAIDGIPMDSDRVVVNPDQIDENCTKLEAIIRDVPPVFVLNVDKTRSADLVDARIEKMVVPADCPLDSIPIPVNQQASPPDGLSPLPWSSY